MPLIAPGGKTTSDDHDAAGRNTRSEQQLDGTDKPITARVQGPLTPSR